MATIGASALSPAVAGRSFDGRSSMAASNMRGAPDMMEWTMVVLLCLTGLAAIARIGSPEQRAHSGIAYCEPPKVLPSLDSQTRAVLDDMLLHD